MNRIVLATNNENKIREIRELLAKFPITIMTRKDFRNFPDIPETGRTLGENAALKARAIYDFTKLPALADDSGLEVPALGGRPGVNSARYAGPNCTYADNNRKLLKEMERYTGDMRKAFFRCVIAVCFGPDDLKIAEGKVVGSISTEPHGTNGFGYDPIFYHPYFKKTFAELTAEEKNKISHRSLAINKAVDAIMKKFEIKTAGQ